MEPKDKAKELVEKMFNVDLDCENEAMCMLYPHAIRCALIAVDEVVNQLIPIEKAVNNKSAFEYWLQVKQEIEKL
jgi:hypothetical protein